MYQEFVLTARNYICVLDIIFCRPCRAQGHKCGILRWCRWLADLLARY